jgi:hypothetical protein
MPRTLVLPRQRLRRQFSKQIAVPGREAAEFLNVPAMGRTTDRASGLGLCDKFVTYSM